MLKHLLLFSLVAISANESTAKRLHKSPTEIQAEMTRANQQRINEQNEKHEAAVRQFRAFFGNRKAQADPTMEVRRANAMRKAVALTEDCYGLRLDSIVTPNVKKRVITSDPNRNRWSHEDMYEWEGEAWVLREKIDYSYDMGGVTLTTYYQSEGGNVATRYTSNYDSRGNLILEIKEHIPAGGTEWMCDQKMTAKYFDGTYALDAELRSTPVEYEVWQGGEKPGEWVQIMKYATKFDSQGRTTYYELQQMDGDVMDGERISVEFDEEGATSSECYSLCNGEWVFTYGAKMDKSNQMLGYTRVTVDDNGVATKTEEVTYEYVDGENLNMLQREKIGDGEWYDAAKIVYTLDANGAIQKYQSWVYDEDTKGLLIDHEQLYTNDKNGHHISSTSSWRDEDTHKWRDVYSITYKYDGDDLAEEIRFDLEENQYSGKTVYTYSKTANSWGVREDNYCYDAQASAFDTKVNYWVERVYDYEGHQLVHDYEDGYSRSRSEFKYSKSGRYVDEVSTGWENGVQNYGYKKLFELDDQERELTCTVSRYDAESKTWYVDCKKEMGYDAEGYINYYRYYYNYSQGMYLSNEGYDIVVTTDNGLTKTANIQYQYNDSKWVMMSKSEEVKNQWGETVQTSAMDYNESTGMWFVREEYTYNFDETQFGANILGGGQNHYMVLNYHEFNSDFDRYSTYYYNEAVPEVKVSENEPKVVAIDASTFMIEIDVRDPKQPDVKPIATSELEAVILKEETVVAVSIPAPMVAPDLEYTVIPLYFTPCDNSNDADVNGRNEVRRKADAKSCEYTLVIKAGSISFNQLVYQHDITMPIALDESLLTGVEDIVLGVQNNSRTYDLMGRSITPTVKGLYIKNGKKVVY